MTQGVRCRRGPPRCAAGIGGPHCAAGTGRRPTLRRWNWRCHLRQVTFAAPFAAADAVFITDTAAAAGAVPPAPPAPSSTVNKKRKKEKESKTKQKQEESRSIR
ncbi:hypothetical protein GGR56DRAFT_678213 [Xylariaceae sp. FL0804]|nr:hypothetical protein GGR56DRAFT_678213 [Xylariaceae sp. FL0804]